MTNTNTTNNTTAHTPEFIGTPVQKSNTANALKEKATALVSDFKKEGPVKAVKKNLRSIIAILLAVIIVLSIGSFLGGLGYRGAVKKTVECLIGENSLYITKTMPNCVWKEYAEQADESVLKLKIGAIGEVMDRSESMKNSYDKISYEIDDFDDLSRKEVREMKECLENRYDSIDEKDIGDKMYETTVSVEFECDGEDVEEEMDVVAVKINGRWYVVSPYGSFINVF